MFLYHIWRILPIMAQYRATDEPFLPKWCDAGGLSRKATDMQAWMLIRQFQKRKNRIEEKEEEEDQEAEGHGVSCFPPGSVNKWHDDVHLMAAYQRRCTPPHHSPFLTNTSTKPHYSPLFSGNPPTPWGPSTPQRRHIEDDQKSTPVIAIRKERRT